jgi:16S rRNA (cytidine1402-2'-O)-methyltransferase
MNKGTVYLIPSVLDEEGFEAIPAYVTDAVLSCTAFFTENERTARRYFKKLKREMVIDDHRWYTIHKAEGEVMDAFRKELREGNTVGIVSEAGLPGIADPGQILVAAAQQMGAAVRPLSGPSSLLLALMASGLNGQRFSFQGYLPVNNQDREKRIRELEAASVKDGSAQLFIETPYRNNPVLETLLKTCKPATRLCIAAELTSPRESVVTKSIGEWGKSKPELHKKPVLFILQA